MDLSAESSPTALQISILGEWCRCPVAVGCQPPVPHGHPSPATAANGKGASGTDGPSPPRAALAGGGCSLPFHPSPTPVK